jgi:hypothetical protein
MKTIQHLNPVWHQKANFIIKAKSKDENAENFVYEQLSHGSVIFEIGFGKLSASWV